MTHVLSWVSALALGAALALPAAAEPRPDPELRSQTVGLSDLDLRSGPGAVTAVSRMSMAARAVCDEYADIRNYRAYAASKRCRQQAMESAVTRLDAPRVSEEYFGRKVRVQIVASAGPVAAPGK